MDRVNWEGTFLLLLQKSMMLIEVFLILLNEFLQLTKFLFKKLLSLLLYFVVFPFCLRKY